MTAQIHVEHLVKEYRVHEREAGVWASVRSLFHRRYRAARAVDSVSFDIAAGERVGFLGPNGAGKTTTIRMLTGLIRPDAGTVAIAGFDVRRDFERAMRHVGAIVESPDLYRELSGRENLELFARMIGREAARRILRNAC